MCKHVHILNCFFYKRYKNQTKGWYNKYQFHNHSSRSTVHFLQYGIMEVI